MTGLVPPPMPPKRLRFTIGGLMLTIGGVAVVLALLRPLALVLRAFSPDLSQVFERLASIETWAVLSCLVIGVYSAARLMAEDEKT